MGTLKNENIRSRSSRSMDFYRKRPERSALGVHIFDILRIKLHTTTMRLGEKIIFQGSLNYKNKPIEQSAMTNSRCSSALLWR